MVAAGNDSLEFEDGGVSRPQSLASQKKIAAYLPSAVAFVLSVGMGYCVLGPIVADHVHGHVLHLNHLQPLQNAAFAPMQQLTGRLTRHSAPVTANRIAMSDLHPEGEIQKGKVEDVEFSMATDPKSRKKAVERTGPEGKYVIVLGLAVKEGDGNFISYRELAKRMNKPVGEYAYTIENFPAVHARDGNKCEVNRNNFFLLAKYEKLGRCPRLFPGVIAQCMQASDLLLFNCYGIDPELFRTVAVADTKPGDYTNMELTEIGDMHNKGRVVWTSMGRDSAVPTAIPTDLASLRKMVPPAAAPYCAPDIQTAVEAYHVEHFQ